MNKFIEMLNPGEVTLARPFSKQEDKLLKSFNEDRKGNQLRGKFREMVKFFEYRSEAVLRERARWLEHIERQENHYDSSSEMEEIIHTGYLHTSSDSE
jgi:thiamine biosynthesis lipoprotein ApbE